MAREPRSFRSLKKLIREEASLGEMLSGVFVENHMDDRATAIIQAINVERALEGAIITRMPAISTPEEAEAILFGNDGPASTFNNKIVLSYALGIIGQNTKDDLDAVRHIRNTFAHAQCTVSFDRPEVQNVCSRLTAPQRAGKTIPNGSRKALNEFMTTCQQIQLALLYWRYGRPDEMPMQLD